MIISDARRSPLSASHTMREEVGVPQDQRIGEWYATARCKRIRRINFGAILNLTITTGPCRNGHPNGAIAPRPCLRENKQDRYGEPARGRKKGDAIDRIAVEPD